MLLKQDESPASHTFQEIAALAQIVLDKCVEFGTSFVWVRGQAFDASLPWNVIVTSQDSFQKAIGRRQLHDHERHF